MYVVLSRVKTRKGLVLCEKLDSNQCFKVSEELTKWESDKEFGLETDLFQIRNEYEQYIDEEQK